MFGVLGCWGLGGFGVLRCLGCWEASCERSAMKIGIMDLEGRCECGELCGVEEGEENHGMYSEKMQT